MRENRWRRVAWALVVLCLVAVPLAVSAEEPLQVLEGKKVYLVKPGDTLAGIAKKILGDQRKWHDIVKMNPQIKNPARIFPGDYLVMGDAPVENAAGVRSGLTLPPVEEAVAAPPPPVYPDIVTELGIPPEEPVSVEVLTPVGEGRPFTIQPVIIETTGYISPLLPEARIIGSATEKTALSTFDTLFIDRGKEDGMEPGQVLTVLHAEEEIFHPVSRKSMGKKVLVAGRIVIDCVQDWTATAHVIKSYSNITIGDRVEPYLPTAMPEIAVSGKLTGVCLPPVTGASGVILASRGRHLSFIEGEVVYTDRSRGDGALPGTRYAIFREEQKIPRLLGELVILSTGETGSAGIITNSLMEIKPGDQLVAW